jgi:hypothetical protein
MLMCDENRIQRVRRFPDRTKARNDLLAAESCVDQDARVLGPDEDRVACAARRKDADLYDALLPLKALL